MEELSRMVYLNNKNSTTKNNFEKQNKNYWLCSAGIKNSMWDECQKEGKILLGFAEVGNYKQYNSKEEILLKYNEILNDDQNHFNNATAIWEFANEIKINDIIYVKKGLDKVIARGVVTSDYVYDSSRSDGYNSYRLVNWTNFGEYTNVGQNVQKTLTNITKDSKYRNILESFFTKNGSCNSEYSEENFLDEVYMDSNEYNRLKNLLLYKKNIILQGPPGVGKTFVASRLAYSILGTKDDDKVLTVQFHQSYSYEDFIMGYRPRLDNDGFEIKNGIFYNFCDKARNDRESNYFLFIDEINRGNLSKIFGELFMLIEKDKRDVEIPLLYNDTKFSVPSNLHIIGTMNTADRSLAIIDYALRRRFSFYTLEPKFENTNFKKEIENFKNDKLDKLIKEIIELNKDISNDESLRKDFMIGHSYFSSLDGNSIDQNISNIVEYEIIPLLEEYWFDNDNKYIEWSKRLRRVIND